MAAAEEESGTALSRMGTALPSAPEAGVRPMEESEETSRYGKQRVPSHSGVCVDAFFFALTESTRYVL